MSAVRWSMPVSSELRFWKLREVMLMGSDMKENDETANFNIFFGIIP
jgi:hypothetical protein